MTEVVAVIVVIVVAAVVVGVVGAIAVRVAMLTDAGWELVSRKMQ